MAAAQAERLHGFGSASAVEFRLRVLAAGLLATAVVVGVFCASGFEWSFLLLLSGSGAAATLLAWLLERSRPSTRPGLRYALLGACVAAVFVLLLEDRVYLLVVAAVAVPTGAAGGALAGLAAARLPRRFLLPTACLSVAALLLSGGVATWRTLPWLSGSYLVVEGPTTAEPGPLAEQIAAALRAAPDPLADEAWGRVASSVVAPREGSSARIGYDRSAGRRQITVWVDGDQACVDVRPDRITSSVGGCS